MEDVLARVWENLGGRIGGPLSFRLILQPMTAISLRDQGGTARMRAITGRLFLDDLTNPDAREELLQEGWKAVAKIFVLAVVDRPRLSTHRVPLDLPGELLIIAFLLACAPYLLVRGPVNRIAGRARSRQV